MNPSSFELQMQRNTQQMEDAFRNLHTMAWTMDLLLGIVGSIVLVFCIIMFFDLMTSSRIRGFERFLWVLVLLGFPGVGALVYFIYGRPMEVAVLPQGAPSVPDPSYFRRVQERLNRAKQEGYGGRSGA